MHTRQGTRTLAATIFLCVLFLLAWTADARYEFRAFQGKQSIADLAWMSGDWQSPAGEPAQIEEHWTKPGGGTMIGMGRTIVGDKTVEFEYLRIEQRGGDIFYVASPQGRPPTDFKLTRLSAEEAVFENPTHDFPKRVIYGKKSDGTMVASIDGGEGTKAMAFPYVPIRK